MTAANRLKKRVVRRHRQKMAEHQLKLKNEIKR